MKTIKKIAKVILAIIAAAAFVAMTGEAQTWWAQMALSIGSLLVLTGSIYAIDYIENQEA